MQDILKIILICLFLAGGLLTGIAGVLYKIRVGSLWANPTSYDDKEKKLGSVGIVLLLIGFVGLVLFDIYLK